MWETVEGSVFGLFLDLRFFLLSVCVCVFFFFWSKKFNIQLSKPLPSLLKWSETFPCSLCVVTCVFCVFVWFHCSGVSVTLDMCVNGEEKAVECCNRFTGTHSIGPFVLAYRHAQKEPVVGCAALTERQSVTQTAVWTVFLPLFCFLRRVRCVFCMCVVWPRSLSSDNLFQAPLWCDKMTDRQECEKAWTAERAAAPETEAHFVYIWLFFC